MCREVLVGTRKGLVFIRDDLDALLAQGAEVTVVAAVAGGSLTT
jgi:molybdopterin converting factor small subunit